MTPAAVALLGALLFQADAPKPAADLAAYDSAIARLGKERQALAASYRAAKGPRERAEVVARARTRLLEVIERELVPAWFGTPWEFYGDSERPGTGAIACGYFVSTILRDAGFRVPRVRLAQQASEHIVKTSAPDDRIVRLRGLSQAEVVQAVRRQGDGLYLIGLDYHVGFLRVEGEAARFCHSSCLEPRAVVCEKAEDAPAMYSTYSVVGDALSDARIVDWLLQRSIAIRR